MKILETGRLDTSVSNFPALPRDIDGLTKRVTSLIFDGPHCEIGMNSGQISVQADLIPANVGATPSY